MQRRTGLVWHERFMWHDLGRYAGLMPAGYPVQPGLPFENWEAKRRLKNLLDASELTRKLVSIEPRLATRTELLRVHTPGYLDRLVALNEQDAGLAGMDAPLTRGSWDIASLAAGGCLAAVDAILARHIDNAYALVRPIGHHAEPDGGKGFCLLSNPSLAAAHALQAHGLERIAIVDLDVHHGNGAQKAFWRDPRVLTISLHQERWFPPDSGDREERGEGDGFGTNLNIPLPAGCGWGAYQAAFERVVLPALRRFQPKFIVVPCGYDAGAQDPLGRMILHSGAYRAMVTSLLEIAAETAGGRLLVTQEGGYNEWSVPFMGLAVFEALSGERSGVSDPLGEIFASMHGHALIPHQELAIDAAATLVAAVPDFR
jgi:acetoin utilization deacetylase AcuC-like enzyme